MSQRLVGHPGHIIWYFKRRIGVRGQLPQKAFEKYSIQLEPQWKILDGYEPD